MSAKKRKTTKKRKSPKKRKAASRGVTLAKLNTRVTHLERFLGSGPH
jgi:hypothetical protein